MVMYNGVEVIDGWPEEVQAAQRYPIIRIEGKRLARIRFGDETDDWGSKYGPCPDCAARKGQLHVRGCDVVQCPGCGRQWLSCGCMKR